MDQQLIQPGKDAEQTRDEPDLQKILTDCYLAYKNQRDGAPASYIPALTEVDPDLFAIAICTVDGQRHSAGDTDSTFTIQSVAKPFLYAAALQRWGEKKVISKVDVEPTGYAFNSVVRLEKDSHRPYNPLVNAGAISVAGMLAVDIKDETAELNSIFLPFMNKGSIEIDNEVFSSEVSTGHRNFAIAHLLKHHGVLDVSVDEALSLYFKSCSMVVSVEDLALMSATLANGGINPISGKQALSAEHTSKVLTVMATCGLYNYSGEFLFVSGFPAKSGVSGAIIAVVPGVMGIALYSPRVDERGNSLRGIRALPFLSERLDLHLFQPAERLSKDRASDSNGGLGASRISNLPSRESLEDLSGALDRCETGVPARYLSNLPASKAENFAVTICDTAGNTVGIGDEDLFFSIQAAINPIVFGHAVELLGLGKVMEKVGLEPSGNSFHSIKLSPDTGLPYNPLINAGALAIDSILPGSSTTERFEPLLERIRNLAGDRSIEIDQEVLRLERENSHGNRAISSLLLNFDVISDADRPLGVYFRQCAISMCTKHIARIAAVLANGGTSPGNGERLLSSMTVRQILALMYTCGLYEYTGRFAYDVGIAAKSGLSGIIMGVVPGKFGVAVYSPPVDRQGNSSRGVEYLRLLSRKFDLNIFGFDSEAQS